MDVRVDLFGPLREAVGTKTVEYELPAGATVADLLDALVADHPALDGRFRADGALRGDVTLTLDGGHVRHRDGLDTALSDGDLLRASPPVKGG